MLEDRGGGKSQVGLPSSLVFWNDPEKIQKGKVSKTMKSPNPQGWYSRSAIVSVGQSLSLFLPEKRDWSFDESLRTRAARKPKLKSPKPVSEKARQLAALLLE